MPDEPPPTQRSSPDDNPSQVTPGESTIPSGPVPPPPDATSQPGYPPPHPDYPPPPYASAPFDPLGGASGPAQFWSSQDTADHLGATSTNGNTHSLPGDEGTGTSGGKGRRVALVVLVAVLVAGLLAGGGVALFGTTGPTNTSRSTSGSAPVSSRARATLHQALAAAESTGTFHYVSTTSGGGGRDVTVGNAGRTSGDQQITTTDQTDGTGVFSVVVVGSTAYFRGNAVAVAENLGLSGADAQAHADQWISLVPSDGTAYSSVYAAVDTHDALSENIAIEPQHLGSTRYRGQTVDTVSGALLPITIPGQGTETVKGTGILEVSRRTHLPVLYSEHGVSQGQQMRFTITFSGYGETVDETAPAQAVPYSSISGGSSGSGSGTSPTFIT